MKNLKSLFLKSITLGIFLIFILGINIQTIKAITLEDIEAQIKSIQKQITQIQQQITAALTTRPDSTPSPIPIPTACSYRCVQE